MADYKNIVSHTLYSEGGKSKDPDDNAAKNPVPDGTGYHTNKGVTWAAFVGLAPKIGYTPTAALFYAMPTTIWLKIFKVGYWDKVSGDTIKSQAVANMLAQRAWGSGATKANTMVQELLNQFGYKVPIDGKTGAGTVAAINQATNGKIKERNFYDAFYKKNMAWLQSLSDWPKYKNGWTKRMNSLYDSGLDLIKGNPVKTAFFFNSDDTSNHIS